MLGVPLTEICNREYSDPRQRQLFQEHHVRGRVDRAARHGPGSCRRAGHRSVPWQGQVDRRQYQRAQAGLRPCTCRTSLPDRTARATCRRCRSENLHQWQRRLRPRRGLRRRDRRRLVPDHAVHLGHRSLQQLLPQVPHRPGQWHGTLRSGPGGGRTGLDRHGHRCLLERLARLHRHPPAPAFP